MPASPTSIVPQELASTSDESNSSLSTLQNDIYGLIEKHGVDAVQNVIDVWRASSKNLEDVSVESAPQTLSMNESLQNNSPRGAHEQVDQFSETSEKSGEHSNGHHRHLPSAQSFRSVLRVKDRACTAMRKSRDVLLRSERLRRGVLDASTDPIFCINESGLIILTNDAATEKFGWTKDEFIGQNISIIVGTDRNSDDLIALQHDSHQCRFLGSKQHHIVRKHKDFTAKRKDGTDFAIEWSLSEIKTEPGEERLFCGFVRDLTERKQYEDEFKKERELTLGIVEASFDPVFCIDETGIILRVNRAAVTTFGWSQEEFIGNNISMIVGGGHAPKHDAYLRFYMKTGEKRVMGKKRELLARKKDGTEFPLELGLAEISTQNGTKNEKRKFCGFIRDLSSQKKYEKELQNQHAMNAGVIEAAFDAMFAIDERGIIRMVNEASCKKFGWTREEFLGQNISMIMDRQHASKHDEYLRRYMETGIQKMIGKQRETTGRKKDGSTFPLTLGLAEIKTEKGSPRMFVGFVRDLTEEKLITQMEIENAEAEALLLNVLPEDIALRLMDDPSHIADHYNNTTILFADLVGFTRLSSSISPADLVGLLNDLFSRFDDLVEKYDLNKVKTIGDCYMVTSIPNSEKQVVGCTRVCHFAFDMLECIENFNRDHHEENLALRIGINTGPVVAGVVGTKRFMYDIWGDAVNVASRMESTGIPGKIQVTKEVQNFIPPNEFVFEDRGVIQVKGKGDVRTCFLVKRNRPALLPSDNGNRRAGLLRLSRRGSAPPNLYTSCRRLKDRMNSEKLQTQPSI